MEKRLIFSHQVDVGRR